MLFLKPFHFKLLLLPWKTIWPLVLISIPGPVDLTFFSTNHETGRNHLECPESGRVELLPQARYLTYFFFPSFDLFSSTVP